MIVDSMDAARLPAAMLRACINHEGLPRTCAIRKCRRDNACTGPLLSLDCESMRLVSSRPSDDPDASLPPCCHALDEASFAALSRLYDAVRTGVANRLGGDFPERTRAIAAEPAPEAQKPLPSENIRAKGAAEQDIGEHHAP